MQTSREYLFFSMLSYYDFPKHSEGSYIKNVLEELQYLKFTSYLAPNSLRDEIKNLSRDFFKKEITGWKIHKIDDRTRENKSKSGFFAIVFKSNEGKYVVAYRGSETYPFEEAYKDFIEADLIIGLGKKPLQFWEGLEVVEDLIEEGIRVEDISITGHSLGGAIAQFAAVMIYQHYEYCPYVCTWSSLGINREGIIGIKDFLSYSKILDKTSLTKEEKSIFLEFEDSYKEYILKELKKEKIVKDNKTLLIYRDFQLYFNIDEAFIKDLTKQTNINKVLRKFPLKRRKELITKDRIFHKLFELENIETEVKSANKFIEKVSENKIFNDRIINFCHSKDFVSSLFPNIGTTYQVDLSFKRKELRGLRGFFSNFKLFRRSFHEYHFEDVYIPLLDERGVFTQRLAEDYIASTVRQVIYLEKSFSQEFLGEYHLLKELPYNDFERFRQELEKGIHDCDKDLLYKDKVNEAIKNMTNDEVLRLWEKAIAKLSSPFIARDIYDRIIFRK